MKVVRTLIAGSALAGLMLAGAAPAHATVIDTDRVYATVSGNTISGSVSWRNYYDGFGRVTIYNDMYDGVCVTASQRVMRAGVWSGWSTIATLCTVYSYETTVYTSNSGQRIDYWQFRLKDADSGAVYDTNSPGGA